MTTPTAQFHLPSFDSTYNLSAIQHQLNQQKFQQQQQQYNLTSSHQQQAAVTAATLAYVQAYNSPPRDIFSQSPQQQHHSIESSDLFTTYPSPGESTIMTESPTHSPPTFTTTATTTATTATTGEHKPVINGDGGYPTNSSYPTAPYPAATSAPSSSYIPSNSMQMDRRSSLGASVPVLPILHQPFASHDTKVHNLPHQDLSTANGSAEQQWSNGNSSFPFSPYTKQTKGFDEKAIDPTFFTDPSMVKPSGSNTTAPIGYYNQNSMYDRNVMPHPGGFPTPQDYPMIAGRFANGTMTPMSAANGNGTPKQSQNQSRPPPVPAPQAMMTTFSSKTVSSTPKRYKCTVCQKRFTRPSSLQTHMYSHTGEKPFKCPIEGCGRHFSVVSNLRRHQKIHANNTNSTTSS